MTAHTAFEENHTLPRTISVPLSHVSIELGHLYMADFERGPAHVRHQMELAAPWVDATRDACARELAGSGRRPRISTCFLIDDYFTRFSTPAEVIPPLLAAIRDTGLELDYLARESACADSDGVPVARLLESSLVPLPLPGGLGTRPATGDSGWLSNGARSSGLSSGEAMSDSLPWTAPVELGAGRHSIFVDVQLWDESNEGRRTWSCPFLAAVWQCMRLGLVRNGGEPVVHPQPPPHVWPTDWDLLPPVVQLRDKAQPFSAYRSLSVLSTRFIPVEHAVRVVLGQAAPGEAVLRQLSDRAAAEGFPVAPEVLDRVAYVFHHA
ncbi:SCO2522 family protein [Yinghuangia sp. YIM S09857]|uniref:SCO2522 family protein n=1 Tax=Yinghuangia sp. YIM S09857 TaxID=3436929 RepID=UPI003F53DA24